MLALQLMDNSVSRLSMPHRRKRSQRPLRSITLGLAAAAVFLVASTSYWQHAGGSVCWGPCEVSVSSPQGSSDSPKKHPHQGLLKPFQRGRPTSISVGASEEAVLCAGKPWFSSTQDGNIGYGKAVVDVDAPLHIVMGQLLDFNKYAGKVPKVSECSIYERKEEGNAKEGITERIKAKFVSPVFTGYKFTYFCDHIYEKAKNSITWTLDYDRYSDFDDVSGHWHVEPHPADNNKSRVFYEVQLMVPKFLPSMVINMLTTKSIKDATTWVKKYSEADVTRSQSEGE